MSEVTSCVRMLDALLDRITLCCVNVCCCHCASVRPPQSVTQTCVPLPCRLHRGVHCVSHLLLSVSHVLFKPCQSFLPSSLEKCFLSSSIFFSSAQVAGCLSLPFSHCLTLFFSLSHCLPQAVPSPTASLSVCLYPSLLTFSLSLPQASPSCSLSLSFSPSLPVSLFFTGSCVQA